MNGRRHHYIVSVNWTGNTGAGTAGYRGYRRTYDIAAEGKPVIAGSADPAFRGDADRWNPEDLLVASLAACHKLWYLHLCADAGIVVTAYRDLAEGTMVEDSEGGGSFESVELRPRVEITDASRVKDALELHAHAHARCFIANSVTFTVNCEPDVVAVEP